MFTHAPALHSVPSGSPSIVSFTADENQAILTLSWTPPVENSLNGPLTGISYRIRYGVVGEQATELHVNSTRTSGSSIQQHVLRNLEYGTTYFALVAAESSNGTGPYSITFTTTTVTSSEKHEATYVHVMPHYTCDLGTYVQLSCFRGGTVRFATFFSVFMTMRVTVRDVRTYVRLVEII